MSISTKDRFTAGIRHSHGLPSVPSVVGEVPFAKVGESRKKAIHIPHMVERLVRLRRIAKRRERTVLEIRKHDV